MVQPSSECFFRGAGYGFVVVSATFGDRTFILTSAWV